MGALLQENIAEVILQKVDTEENWYVFYVSSRHELRTERLLHRDGFTTYLPIISNVKQWSDRKKKVEEPLFKSYIFVKIRKNQIYDVLQTPSVITYVRFAGEPAIVRQKHIDLIKELILNKTKFKLKEKTIKIGQKIKLSSGPFKGQTGTVREFRGSKKLLINLETINFTLEIEL